MNDRRFLSLLVTLCALIASGNHVIIDRFKDRSDFVEAGGALRGDETHEVLFAVRQQNLGVLDEELARRSTPGSPLYQQWLSFDDVGKIIDTDQSYEAVRAYLNMYPGAEVIHVSRRKEYVKVKAPVALLNEMFQTQFHRFVDRSEKNRKVGSRKAAEEDRTFIRAYDYVIPAELTEHLHTVFHTIQVPPIIDQHATVLPVDENTQMKTVLKPSLRRRLSSESISATGYVDPVFLQYNYNIPIANGSSLVNQSVFETDSQYFSPGDLLQFQKIFDLPQQAAIAADGFTTNDCSLTSTPNCNEGNLDVQYIMALAQNTVTLYTYIGTSDPFVDYLSDIADQQYPSLANSISWGSTEQSENNSTMFNFNLEAKKLGLIGVTITVASGDDGVANRGATTCDSSAPATRKNCACNADSSSSISLWQGPAWSGKGYFPSFPATSPYITSVGATMGPQVAAEEVACQSNMGGVITSGGASPRTILARRGRIQLLPATLAPSPRRHTPDTTPPAGAILTWPWSACITRPSSTAPRRTCSARLPLHQSLRQWSRF